MLANANSPSAGRSCSLLPMFSFTIHLEINEELLFAILFFGFALFAAFLVTGANRLELPSPNTGADPIASGPELPFMDVRAPSLLPGATSADVRPSFGCSLILEYLPLDNALRLVSVLYKSGGARRELRDKSEILVPAVAGCGVVARGFGFIIGASEGCGGGVARCRSSLRIYVPLRLVSPASSTCHGKRIRPAWQRTLSHHQLVLWSCWMGQDIVRLDHGRSLSICDGEIVRGLRRIPRWWR